MRAPLKGTQWKIRCARLLYPVCLARFDDFRDDADRYTWQPRERLQQTVRVGGAKEVSAICGVLTRIEPGLAA
jgi:hypothetical protein